MGEYWISPEIRTFIGKESQAITSWVSSNASRLLQATGYNLREGGHQVAGFPVGTPETQAHVHLSDDEEPRRPDVDRSLTPFSRRHIAQPSPASAVQGPDAGEVLHVEEVPSVYVPMPREESGAMGWPETPVEASHPLRWHPGRERNQVCQPRAVQGPDAGEVLHVEEVLHRSRAGSLPCTCWCCMPGAAHSGEVGVVPQNSGKVTIVHDALVERFPKTGVPRAKVHSSAISRSFVFGLAVPSAMTSIPNWSAMGSK